MSSTFSIIIPYKNTEKYIEECLQSVLDQTFTDFEVLCINDYSEDKTENIVQSFVQRDTRFINILNTGENKGVGTARNIGIKNAKGKYIVFLDSDDRINKKLLQKLDNAFQKNPDKDSIWYNAFEDIDGNIIKKVWFKRGSLSITPQNILNYPEYAWTKSFRKDFIIKNNLKFQENVYFEGDLFYFDMAFHSPKIYCINDALYYYRRHSSSITGHSKSVFKRNNHFFKVMLNVYKIIVENNYNSEWKSVVRNYAQSYVSQYKVTVNPFLSVEYKKFLRNIDKLDL